MSSVAGRIAPSRFARLLLLADLAAVVTASTMAVPGAPRTAAENAAWAPLTVTLIALWLVVATGLRHYDLTEARSLFDDLAMAIVLVAAAAAAVAAAEVLSPADIVPRLSRFLLILWPLAMGTRLLARLHRPADDEAPEKVLVVGVGHLGLATAAQLHARLGPGIVAGFLHFPVERAPESLPAPLLGSIVDLESVLEKVAVGEVYLAGHATREAGEMQRAIDVCETLGVPFALPAHDFRLQHALAADTHGPQDGYLHFQEIERHPVQMALKRLFDIVASGGALLLLSPLLLTVALLIRLESPGSPLFRQPRLGLHGRPFRMLKFRSMVIDAEHRKAQLLAKNEQTGPVFKMKDDPRVTAVGHFIRRYSIDELPQLINVLRGDMSIVGPRPAIPSEVALYQPWQRRRLSVRPGLTCIWQVSGRNAVAFERWMYLDLQYIDHWSLLGDLRLILKTFPVVLTGRGAS